MAASRPWRTSKTNALWALLWTAIRRGTNCLIKLWIVCVPSPSSFVKPRRKKKKEKRGCKKRGNLLPSVKGSSAWKGIICPLCGHLHVAFVSHTAHYFSLRSTQACQRRCTFLLFCSHLADRLWFSKGEINVALTLYSKQMSPCKENVPLCRRPVILHRVRMCKLVLRKYDKSAHLSSSSMHGVWFSLKFLHWLRPFSVCGHIQLHLFYFILFCFI